LADDLADLLPQANVLYREDTFNLVKNAADFMRQHSGCCVIGVTGSAGKSSTVAMLLQALSIDTKTKDVFQIKGRNRNLFQDVLHSMTKLEHAKHAVLEVSASHKYERYDVYPRPNIAIFTSLSAAHSEYLGHIADIAMVKSALFKDMPAGGLAIINADMPCIDFVLMRARQAGVNVVLYGESPQANVRLLAYDFASGRVEISMFGVSFFYHMAQLGKHLVINSMAILIVLRHLGLAWQHHAQHLHHYQPEAGRGKLSKVVIGQKQVTVLDESYNANPASVSASLALLSQLSTLHNARAVAVLADMLELGSQSEQQHQQLLKPILAAKVENVILVGNAMQALWQQLPVQLKGAILPDTTALAAHLEAQLNDGDIVLFKGSRAMALSELLQHYYVSLETTT